MKYLSRPLLYTLWSVGLFSAMSCSDSSELGLSLVEQEPSAIIYTDTSTVLATTVEAQASITSARTSMVCGSFTDSEWGESRASAYLNFRLRNTGATFPNATFDSLVLTIAYENFGHYGELINEKPTPTVQVWEVARMTQGLQDGSDYRSDETFPIEPALLKSNFTFQPNDTGAVTIDGVALPPHIRIRLDDQAGIDLGNTLLNPTGAAANIYASNTDFKDWFKGLLIRPASTNPSNGSIVRLRSKDALTKLTLYYTNNTSGTQETFDYLTNEDAEVFTAFEHTPPAELLDNLPTDTVVYVQGLDGLQAKVEFPYIGDLGRVIINRAELVFTLVDTGSMERPNPIQVVAKVRDSGGRLLVTDDIASSILNTQSYLLFGGALQAEANNRLSYRMTLSEELQAMVEGRRSENAVYIDVPSSFDAERVQLYNHNGRFPVQLLLTYTRY